MPFTGTAPNKTFSRTDGSRTGTTVWAQAEGAGVDILSADADTHDQDIATAIDSLILKDGGNQPSADLPMNDKKHTGVADATGRKNYAAMGQVADNDDKFYGDLSGTDTYTVSGNGFTPASYHDGFEIDVTVVNANTGASTVNVASIGAADIVLQGDVALSGGELPAGYKAKLRYCTAYAAFVVISVLAGSGLIAAMAGSDGAGSGLDADLLDGQQGSVYRIESFVVAASDEISDLTTGLGKATFRMPYAFTVTDVRASVTTAPTGAVLTVDINDGGTTILSTKLTIDATEKTSETAATPPVISDSALADDAEITIDIDTVGSTVAGAGLKVAIIGTRDV